jgi:hypothetical protein
MRSAYCLSVCISICVCIPTVFEAYEIAWLSVYPPIILVMELEISPCCLGVRLCLSICLCISANLLGL